MKTILIPFLFLFSSAFGQQWSLALNLSPDLCHRYIHTKESDLATTIEHQREWDKPKFGYTVGLTGIYTFGSRLEIEAGTLYSNKGYQSQMIIGEPNTLPNSVPYKAEYWFNDHCIDIPMKVNYFIGNGKMQFIGSVALTSNIFFIEKEYVTYFYSNGNTKDYKDEDKSRYNAYMLTPEIGVGVNLDVSERFAIRAIPTFRYTVLNVQKNEPIKTNLYSFGLGFSLVYKISKQ